MLRRPPTSTLFPYTRSSDLAAHQLRGRLRAGLGADVAIGALRAREEARRGVEDRKSTRLNSSHLGISYAVFCLKKKTTGIMSHASSNDQYDQTQTTTTTDRQ